MTNTTENWKGEFLKVIHELDNTVDPSKRKYGMGSRIGAFVDEKCRHTIRKRFEAMEGFEVNDHPDYTADHCEFEEYCVVKSSDPERGFTVRKEVYTPCEVILTWF